MERCNDGRKKKKRVEGYNLAANKIRDARCERNRGIERIEYNLEYDEERTNKQGEKVEYERKLYSLKKEVNRKMVGDNDVTTSPSSDLNGGAYGLGEDYVLVGQVLDKVTKAKGGVDT